MIKNILILAVLGLGTVAYLQHGALTEKRVSTEDVVKEPFVKIKEATVDWFDGVGNAMNKIRSNFSGEQKEPAKKKETKRSKK